MRLIHVVGLATLALGATLLVQGCTPSTPAEQAQAEVKSATENLPSGATDVTPIGNNWTTFRMVVNGQERAFLYRYNDWGNATTETITELKP